MVFWSSFARKVRDAITRKEFNALKENVNDNTNNISTNSNRIDGLSNDISNIRNRVNTNTNNITTNSNNINALNTNLSQANNKINNLEQTKANKTQLDSYYTKSQSDSKFATKTELQQTTDIANNANLIANDALQGITEVIQTKADKTQLNNYYNKDFINDKLLNRTRTTVRTVRQVPTNFNGFWWCDFETEFFVGDNNVSGSYIEIVSCYLEGTSNNWVRVKPLKWYINGGRVGVVLFSSSNGDMNNLAVGRNVVINWFKSAYWERPRGNLSVYKE